MADILNRREWRKSAGKAAGLPWLPQFTVVGGASAATNIAISGIKRGVDKVLSVVKLDFTLGEAAPNTRTWEASDLTSEASITSDGNIQLSTTDTTAEILLVFWYDARP